MWESRIEGEPGDVEADELDLPDWDERDADPDYRGPLSDLLERLASEPPDAEAVAILAGIDPAALDDDDRFRWLQAADRAASWVASLVDRGLVAVAGERTRRMNAGHDADGRRLTIDDPAREEIALALRWSPAHAHARITTARRLATLLPGTAAALAAGDIDGLRARILADHAGRLVDSLPEAADPTAVDPDPALVAVARDLTGQFEDRVLPQARRRTAGRIRSSCERAVCAIDPEGATARASRARRGRDVGISPLPDGQALWWARLDAASAIACSRRVQSLADDMRRQWQPGPAGEAAGGEPLMAGEWRAEAFAAMLLGSGTGSGTGCVSGGPRVEVDDVASPVPVPGGGSFRAQVDVVIDLPTLLGLADDPAELVGYGPLPAATARELIAIADEATWRRLVTDPVTGHLLDVGRRRYEVPDSLRRQLVRRDVTCRFPGCSRAADAVGVDLDHAVPWREGGRTDRANLGALCRRHHRLKTHAGWRITGSRDDGSCTWISPNGLSHQRQPRRVLDPPHRRAPTSPPDALDPPPV